MIERYLFYGVVLPERAPLTLKFESSFSHLASGADLTAKVSIINNQVAVWVQSERKWDVTDLRNVVKDIVENQLALLGYLRGYAYDFEVTRVLNQCGGIDLVFGIDIPCLAERGKGIDMNEALAKLREKTNGPRGIFLHRCFNDLVSSMKHAEDTAFYCYRAIESLRHHCAAIHGLSELDKPKQWEKFREVSCCSKERILAIKTAADPLRHGAVTGVTAEDRRNLFTNTWDIVDGYLKSLEPTSPTGGQLIAAKP